MAARVRFLLAVAVLMVSASPVRSQDSSSGNGMLQPCKEALQKKPGVMQGYCVGTVAAVLYFAQAFESQLRYCRPNAAGNEQGLRVLVRYLETNPDKLHLDIRILTLQAFHQAWPCKQESPAKRGAN